MPKPSDAEHVMRLLAGDAPGVAHLPPAPLVTRVPTCPTCGHALTAFCPRCRGRAGGVVKSRAKAKAGKRNARKARKARTG